VTYTNDRLRQPVQTLYGGAHLFRPDTTQKLAAIARKAWDQFGPTGRQHERIAAKLKSEPIEDLRVDFEDGYGVRSNEEEDAHAMQAAKNFSDPAVELPDFTGIRIKSFSGPTRARAERTLRLFLDNLRRIPANFVITLPKIETPDDLQDLAALLPESIAIEAMIETPAILPHLRDLPQAAAGKLRGAHFGPYDFTSACGILSVDQDLHHPLCDTARHQMLIAFAGTPVTCADGPTATLPLGSDPALIRSAWDLHQRNVRRSIRHGFYQSWDLHPAQLPARYAAIFDLFHEAAESTAARLRNFLAKAAQATALGTAFDDAATVLGYLIFFDRAIQCGAFTPDEVLQMTGMTTAQVSARAIPQLV
jgi:citrate lyase beta subunit